jgi:hypothetical protein
MPQVRIAIAQSQKRPWFVNQGHVYLPSSDLVSYQITLAAS